ncbi:hypothetical protein DSD19_17355 [Rhodovulum sp. BSW8]|uniref:Uncharacterized protein n=1 Tax=Rhodovulum visakhapatnamense TaxID=364297 RepID=A0A4R8FQ25_9RHOB|nr:MULTISPECIES: hypothetical protein [Rhodovulum]OLS44623.1 hypothetical protein BV509_09915 [Rhodovulum sulfidophilum]MBL3570815.1 hypothetical protein [Rhodovulum visakhapatnamense]MBL3580367.1 hypothetical protein [Rhodovulum visakhapatnamense]RBO51871.1 hypothetical protein DSD19_17355 [Rhodovulum sp. BSW8]TDX28551.1 hypothetical protein EV657_11168 [Rhodovulum visakhapatnamense]
MLGLVFVGMAVGYACAGLALLLTQSWLVALATLSLTGTIAVLAAAARLWISDEPPAPVAG